MFNESIQNNYTISYDGWYTEPKLANDEKEIQVDIGSAQHVMSPNYLIASFQTANRIDVPNKNRNVAIFNNFNVRKYFCEKDGYRYPKDAVLTKFAENDYLDQYRDLQNFF